MTMQERIMAALHAAILKRGLEPTDAWEFSNIVNVYAQSKGGGFRPVDPIHADFQPDRFKMSVGEPGRHLHPACGKCWYLKYTDGPAITKAIEDAAKAVDV